MSKNNWLCATTCTETDKTQNISDIKATATHLTGLTTQSSKLKPRDSIFSSVKKKKKELFIYKRNLQGNRKELKNRGDVEFLLLLKFQEAYDFFLLQAGRGGQGSQR